MTEHPAQPTDPANGQSHQPGEGEQVEPEHTTNDLSQQDDADLDPDQTPAADLDEENADAEGNGPQ